MAEQGARDGLMAPREAKPKPSGKTSSREHGARDGRMAPARRPSPGAWATENGGFKDAKKTGTNTKAPGQHG